MKAKQVAVRCAMAALFLLAGYHLQAGGSHTDPPDVDGLSVVLGMTGGSDDGSLSDPPDVERLL
ncbi:hypothetical protein J19TS2_39960 [Cohnella xylanilytica]|uniref:Uncharacterized protein n=1 Tax=Cohnella xylanilytica TaxID=557555 RepID=A0A841U2S5_9BACL|nr:hypothetical protein [Cohnella xylanilytica]MBB6694079.1 hypothetical protein [Cohnella xylanilytica]GIO14441.1 hypothetical protein J19TS2_39960 [Cohnella xylanilytica]